MKIAAGGQLILREDMKYWPRSEPQFDFSKYAGILDEKCIFCDNYGCYYF